MSANPNQCAKGKEGVSLGKEWRRKVVEGMINVWQGLWNQRSARVGRHVKVRSSAEVLSALELGRLFLLAHRAAGGRAQS